LEKVIVKNGRVLSASHLIDSLSFWRLCSKHRWLIPVFQ